MDSGNIPKASSLCPLDRGTRPAEPWRLRTIRALLRRGAETEEAPGLARLVDHRLAGDIE